ncbi:hypothetical protein LARV_03676 [Longilinea arvoryzae]|uniref:Gingipain domain-containing protein n=1 Tax=Longilinea arvoryzae TaxID=360412 RepID=A0A0S7BPU4_9CHLR|nr:hypothetical protein [Longilinea arvoryzae]GAP15882.1 hypothetical protein LARV_03676 [Longilinea arvoryzae]
MPKAEKIYINGINAATGDYFTKPMTVRQVVRQALRERDRRIPIFLRAFWGTEHLGPEPDWSNPAEAGWGVVFHEAEDDRVRQALQPLIDHRRTQIDADRVKVLDYRDGESKQDWLARFGITAGSRDPLRVPYYLLLAGSPERIPLFFGHSLDFEYAVGRLHFDSPDEYAAYARSVVAYESAPPADLPHGREAAFFGTRHLLDRATQLSADGLVRPLVEGAPAVGPLPAYPPVTAEANYRLRSWIGEPATKAGLTGILAPPAGQKPPAFLFTASHGLGFASGDPDQTARQGALLCQDWQLRYSVTPAQYFAAADLPAEARVHGLVAFLFACFGGGTPAFDRFTALEHGKPVQLAPRPFFAALPRALLAHPNGGALAVIAHVDRAWGFSIQNPGALPQIDAFRNTIQRILSGKPVGYAIQDFNFRYADLSIQVSSFVEEKLYYHKNVPDDKLAVAWVQRNDAEGYVVLGDPAVRLRSSEID